MGGVIGLTIREENGQEHRMSTWTNSIGGKIDTMEIVRKNPHHIKMIVDDFDIRQKDPECYTCHSPYLAPEQYGLVVVDLMKNVILSANGYRHFGLISAASLALEEDDNDYPLSAHARFKEFHKEKRIKNVLDQYGKPLDLNINDWPMDKIKNEYLLPESYTNRVFFKLDMSPLTVQTFSESDYLGIKLCIEALGFAITPEEEEIWQKEINR